MTLPIGEPYPVFIIAEAGVNHNGDLDTARRLIDAAAQAGADAVKFQTFSADRLVTRSAAKAAYQKQTTAAQTTRPNQETLLSTFSPFPSEQTSLVHPATQPEPRARGRYKPA